MGDEFVTTSDFWIAVGLLVGVTGSAYGWLLNKVWGNQREVRKVQDALSQEIERKEDRFEDALHKLREEQKGDYRDALAPIRQELSSLSARIDRIVDKGRR